MINFNNERRIAKTLLLAVAALCMAAPVQSQETQSMEDRLNALFLSYTRDVAPFAPFSASENGASEYDSKLANDLGEEYRRDLGLLCNRYLNEVRAINRAELSHQAQLSRDIFERQRVNCVYYLGLNWHLMPINQTGGGLTANFPVMGAGKGSHPFKTVRNYEDFLGRIDGFVVWVDTAIANMRIGMARGITPPQSLMVKVVPQLDAHIVAGADKSMFYEPLKAFPEDFDEATRKSLTEKYTVAIEAKILPSYRKLRAFIQDEYIPKCRTTSGLRDLPGGMEMYRVAVRDWTTTDMSSDQIHALGVTEVARIAAQMKQLRAEIDIAHDAPLPQYRDAASLLDGYRALRSTVEHELPKLFGRLPRTDFEIRAIEPFREDTMSSSYYPAPLSKTRAAIFYLNAASLKTSGHAIVSRSLFIHEATPGHHLQMSLQRENSSLPMFRRTGWYSAYGEGWALYAERLGADLGVYPTRRDMLMMLSDELFRAARLVVDTGLHDKGWTRQRAIDYMRNTGELSAAAAEREVERYMAWPAQALTYKVGQLKIQEIRRKAESKLGAAFDLRAFHDELLRDGAMPLDILEAKMERWLNAQ
jgi:uncharacterized protein (DUF885 family)